MDRLVMFGIDAGGIAGRAIIDSSVGSSASGFVSFVKGEFLTFVHSRNVNRLRRFKVIVHRWSSFLWP